MDASRSRGQMPALLFPTPTPTPPQEPAFPSSSLSLSSSSSSRGHAASITNFPILVLTVLGVLTTSVLLLAYYVFVIRCCLTWHRHRASSSDVAAAGLASLRRPRRPQRATTSDLPAPSDTTTTPADPRGLEDAAIRALPAFRYAARNKKHASSSSNSECAVCLGEFEEDDSLRMLPACLHVFHLHCVDAWLQANANCPLCRCRADGVTASHCLQLPSPQLESDHQLRHHHQQRPEDDDDEVVILQVVVPGAVEGDQGSTMMPQQQQQQQQQRGEVIMVAPAISQGQHTPTHTHTDHHRVEVGSEKTNKQSTITIDACHDHDISGVSITTMLTLTERKDGDGDVVPLPSRSLWRPFSMDSSMAGGEVHLHIHEILQRESHGHSHRDEHDRDSDSSSSGSG